jgi:hypothetical protein
MEDKIKLTKMLADFVEKEADISSVQLLYKKKKEPDNTPSSALIKIDFS